MKICMIAEGCYPYVVGGVSSWIHSFIKSFPNQEFVVVAIVSDRKISGKFVYDLPENVSEVREVYLQDVDWAVEKQGHFKKKRFRLNKKERKALLSLLVGKDVQWDILFKLIRKPGLSLNNLLMGEDFLDATKKVYRMNYANVIFSDFLWTLRSIYLPLFLVMQTDMPQADLYHCVATGYSGVLGAMGVAKYPKSRLLISEHGIYTREREEELIKAKWVQGVYKNIWIDQFKKMSRLAYDKATTVTSLFEHARELQIELGCAAEKTVVTPNGVDPSRFADIPGKLPEDEKYCNIGAVLRVTPIKDVKTMIRSFALAKKRCPNLKLWLMGPTDEDAEYAQQCFEMVDAMSIEDVVFTGRVNVTEYLGRMDLTILTSISEGQPLTILEGYAAHKPVIATDVGNCRGLIYGETDDYGAAGILTHIMNTEEIADAMVSMGLHKTMREEMGEIGYRRLMNKYKLDDMKRTYYKIYQQLAFDMWVDFYEPERPN